MAKQENTPTYRPNSAKIIDFFTGEPLNGAAEKSILRIAPELDNLEMLYTNDSTPNKLYSMKIACWAFYADGTVSAMVPWLDGIIPAEEINDPLNGRWEGYRNPLSSSIFYEPPHHKMIELETAAEFHEQRCHDHDELIDPIVVQEIPDVIGTHAVLTKNGFRSFSLIEVLSWQLHRDGSLHGMLVDESSVQSTPVLPGDKCLFSAQKHPEFRYFFQHRIANKIKQQDPDALAAVALLIEQ